MKSICAHCGKLIEESSCRAYVNERGADIEHVHRQCEAAYEAALQDFAGRQRRFGRITAQLQGN